MSVVFEEHCAEVGTWCFARGWSNQVMSYGSRFEGRGDTCGFWEPDTHLQNAQEVVEA